MGLCSSSSFMRADDLEAMERSKAFDEEIKEDAKRTARDIKLLLFGGAESGKSTVIKQMDIFGKKGYSREDCEQYRTVIYSNTIHSLVTIIQAMKTLHIEYGSSDREQDAAMILNNISRMGDTEPLERKLLDAMKNLWHDNGVQQCFNRSNEYQLNGSAKYFLDKLYEVFSPNYLPCTQDILRTRVKTDGIVEINFTYKDRHCQVVNVAGQRTERKKWLHCFDNVSAIVFVVALDEYDQVLVEDETVNSMRESLRLFDSICNNRFFINISIILLLNKKDLFAEKITRSTLRKCFPEYQGKDEYTEASEYIQAQFVAQNKSEQKEIYCHLMCATDDVAIHSILDCATDSIITRNLRCQELFQS